VSIRGQYRGHRTDTYSRIDIIVIRTASGISGRARDATRFSARRAHFEMLVNWRGREGRGTRARGCARGEVDALRQGNVGAANREQKEDTDDHRFLDRYYAPFLRPGKARVPGWNTVVVVVEKRARWRGRNAPFVREMRRSCADNARSTSTYCIYSCASTAFRFGYLDLINAWIFSHRLKLR